MRRRIRQVRRTRLRPDSVRYQDPVVADSKEPSSTSPRHNTGGGTSPINRICRSQQESGMDKQQRPLLLPLFLLPLAPDRATGSPRGVRADETADGEDGLTRWRARPRPMVAVTHPTRPESAQPAPSAGERSHAKALVMGDVFLPKGVKTHGLILRRTGPGAAGDPSGTRGRLALRTSAGVGRRRAR
jgi:hypothetical protein